MFEHHYISKKLILVHQQSVLQCLITGTEDIFQIFWTNPTVKEANQKFSCSPSFILFVVI